MQAARRNPFISFLLSFITPGLGQLYNGQPKKGMLCLLAGYALTVGVARICSGPARTFPGLAALFLGTLALSLAISGEALVTAARGEGGETSRVNRWYVYLTAVLFGAFVAGPVILLPLKVAGIRLYRIASDTMEPTLLAGEWVAGEVAPYRKRKPARGDVVIFPYRGNPSREFIKRVVVLEGETVAIAGGKVTVNGLPLAEPWTIERSRPAIPAGGTAPDSMAATTVPPGSVFVLGDSRDISFDSRFYGPVETGRIRARALYVVWSKVPGGMGRAIF